MKTVGFPDDLCFFHGVDSLIYPVFWWNFSENISRDLIYAKKYPHKDENFLMQRGMGLLIKVSEPYLSKESKIIIKDLHGGALI